MDYNLSINLKSVNKVEIFLKNRNFLLNRSFWQDRKDLDKKLLVSIDKILKKSKIEIKNIKQVRFSFDPDTSFISQQILKTTAKAVMFALQKN